MDRKDGSNKPTESMATSTIKKNFLQFGLFFLIVIHKENLQSLRSEIFFNAMHNSAAVTNCGGNLAQLLLTYIPYSEYTWNIGCHFIVGNDIALFIDFQFWREERIVRKIAYKNENTVDVQCAGFIGFLLRSFNWLTLSSPIISSTTVS